MKTIVPIGIRVCRRRWAQIMGPIVLVWRWKANSEKVLVGLCQGLMGNGAWRGAFGTFLLLSVQVRNRKGDALSGRRLHLDIARLRH